MKTINILAIITFTLSILTNCDKIEPPYIEGCANCCGENNTYENRQFIHEYMTFNT